MNGIHAKSADMNVCRRCPHFREVTRYNEEKRCECTLLEVPYVLGVWFRTFEYKLRYFPPDDCPSLYDHLGVTKMDTSVCLSCTKRNECAPARHFSHSRLMRSTDDVVKQLLDGCINHLEHVLKTQT